jgi:hypothetical protein
MLIYHNNYTSPEKKLRISIFTSMYIITSTHLLEKVLGELLKGETCPKIPQTYENSSCGEFTGCG